MVDFTIKNVCHRHSFIERASIDRRTEYENNTEREKFINRLLNVVDEDTKDRKL